MQAEHFPEQFIHRMKTQLGAEADAFFHALSQPSPTSIRLNYLKGKSSFTNPEQIPWCEEGYYLPARPSFHLDPHWHGGAYYVQEASSMILEYVIKQLNLDDKARIWLDVCAAPGGKTGILAKHLGQSDVLIANEVVPQRRSTLRENLMKGGYLNTFIAGEKTSAFKEPFADIILVDAPCAGEGMMRKEPEAIRQWSPNLVKECSLLQQEIVNNVIKSLCPGGCLIYSTCSYSNAENIDNVDRFLQHNSLVSIPFQFPVEWNITTREKNGVFGYQLYPHMVRGEGLFIAVLKKDSESEHPVSKNKKQLSEFIPVPGWLNQHVNEPESMLIRKSSEQYSFITSAAEEKANEVLQRFPRAEILADAGQLKGKDFVPSHFSAMSRIQKSRDQVIDLSLDASLDYLERETKSLPANNHAGWFLASYQGTILGWAKMTNQGWKNHYPLRWRLRSRKIS